MLQTKPEWNDTNISIAKAMWADGASQGKIADRLGFTRNAVSGYFNRNRDLFPRKTEGEVVKGGAFNTNTAFSKFWTEHRLSEASYLWRKGIKRGVIAACIGCKTDSMTYVIKKFPSYFPPRENVNSAQDARSGNGRPQKANQRRRAFYEAGMTVPKVMNSDTVPFLMPIAAADTVTVRDDMCKWPVAGEGQGTIYCGAEMRDKSFCLHHLKIAYQVSREAV